MLSKRKYKQIIKYRIKYILLFYIFIVILPIIGLFIYEPVYKASAQLKIIYKDSQTQYANQQINRVAVFEYADETKIDDTFFDIIKNPISLNKTINELNLTDSDGNKIHYENFEINNEFKLFFSKVNEGFKASYTKNAGEILEITAYSPDPKRAVKISNTTVKHFLDIYSKIFKSRAKTALLSMEKRLNIIDSKILNYQKKYFDLLENNFILNTTKEIEYKIIYYHDLLKSYNQILIDIEKNKTEHKQVISVYEKIPKLTMNQKSITRNSLLDEYKKEITGLQAFISKLSVDVTQRHPDIVASKKQIKRYTDAIKKEVEKIFSEEQFTRNPYSVDLFQRLYDNKISKYILKKEKEILSFIIDKTLLKISDMRKDYILLQQIERRIDNLNEEYNNLSNGINSANLILEMDPQNVAVLNYADISLININKPFFPNKGKIFFMCNFLYFSTIFMFLLVTEELDKSIKYIDEIKIDCKVPYILIKGIPKKYKDLIKNKEISSIAWNIISSIRYNWIFPQIIQFTGVVKNVGNNTTSFICARELALNGLKTLLLNFSGNNIKHEEGFIKNPSNHLHSDVFKLNKYINETVINDFYIANIPYVKNITSKLEFQKYIKTLPYDCIVISTSSGIDSNDYLLMSLLSDVIIVSAKFRKTDITDIKEVLNSFSNIMDRQKIALLINNWNA